MTAKNRGQEILSVLNGAETGEAITAVVAATATLLVVLFHDSGHEVDQALELLDQMRDETEVVIRKNWGPVGTIERLM